ncbi:hypothetical protein LC593_17960 [Nostoc sp. CHAB 5844]|nr:hypothetical protein [Nostoc sp. CHAB 5844]
MIGGGRGHIRASVDLGAVVAIRHNRVIKAFYERLIARGKSQKLLFKPKPELQQLRKIRRRCGVKACGL